MTKKFEKAKLAFVSMKRQSFLSQSCEYHMHIPIILLYATTMYNQIMSQIGHSSSTLQDISNNFLVFLIRCDCYAEHQVHIDVKSTACNQCGDLARFLLKFHLMEPPLELEFREHSSTVQIVQDLFNRRNWVPISRYLCICSAHVHTNSNIAVRLWDHN